ncbi:MAG: LysR substrate-binding domain-containing protein [Pseudomonadota bacterium]
MPTLTTIETFVHVAQELSFTKAANLLQVSRTIASKRIADLEAELGIRLFDRTTRSVQLTEAGTLYLTRAETALETLQLAGEEASQLSQTPMGKLRVTAPLTFGARHLGDPLSEFHERFPHVEVDLFLSDRHMDLIEDGYDVALRIGILKDSTLIARKLCTMRRMLCASPAYLADHGTPKKPEDLRHHKCLGYRFASEGSEWHLHHIQRPEDVTVVRVNAALRTNNGEVNLQFAQKGLGITSLPDFIVAESISAGRLVPVLPDYQPEPLALHVVFPPGPHQPQKTRVFVDHMADWFRKHPSFEAQCAVR